MFKCCASVLLAVGAGAVSAQALEFKGTPMGVSMEQFSKQHPEFTCGTYSCEVGNFTCAEARTPWECSRKSNHLVVTTYAGERVQGISAAFEGGAFERLVVAIAPASYEAVKAALSEKFGAPEVASGVVSNRVGYSTEDEISTWNRAAGVIYAQRYGPDLNTGLVVLQSAASKARADEASRAKEAKRKSDL